MKWWQYLIAAVFLLLVMWVNHMLYETTMDTI